MNLDLCKIGHVLATKYDGKYNLFSEAIYKKQLKSGFASEDAKYTHVAILSGGPWAVNIMPPRAKLEDITKRYNNTYAKILRYKGDDFDNHLRYKVGCIYNALAANLKYDYFGILAFLWPFAKQAANRPFCSEATLQAYQWFYPLCFQALNPSHCMPAEFVASDEFEVFWEGMI